MVITTLLTHWQICKKLRHGTEEEKRMSVGYFRGQKVLPQSPIIAHALEKVDLHRTQKAS